jgi:hypothetical protein
VAASAPRIAPELVGELQRIDDGVLSIAEVCRRVGAAAERLGLARPSYEQVRVLVHERRLCARRTPTGSVLVDVALRARPPDALLDHLAGVDTRERAVRRPKKS